MSVSVVVPWGGSDLHRLNAWGYVSDWYTSHFPQWQVCLGSVPEDSRWCKADAIWRALGDAEGDILVIADADCIAPALPQAVDRVRRGGASWAMPHRSVHRLNREATRRVLAGEDPTTFPTTRQFYSQFPYPGYAGGGITVLPRRTYLQAPMDHRFIGWGQEDQAWALALQEIAGRPWRPTRSPLWHLWHPPQNRMNRLVGSEESRKLFKRYRQAAASGMVESLLEEPRLRGAVFGVDCQSPPVESPHD